MKFVLCNADTDSISIRKPDNSLFSKDERKLFIDKLNSSFPELINFADDGYFTKFIVLKTKNYIMLEENGKLVLKGSSLKSATLEPIMKQFLKEIIDSLLDDRQDFVDIYHKYVRMASNITDIRPWCSKKTISEKTLNAEGTTQAKMREAMEDSDYVEGDRVYMFFDEDDKLVLAENFKGSYNKNKMYEKLYKATSRFWTVINEDMFINYKLKRNKDKLIEILK